MPTTAPWDINAPLQRLVTIVTGLAGVQKVYIGIPAHPDRKLCAYLTIGGQVFVQKTTGGQAQRQVSYRVVFTYALDDDNENAAETGLTSIIDAFVDAVLTDKTLAGTLERLELDGAEADRPQYAQFSGEEFRQYPMSVRGDQRKVYPVT